MSLLSRDLSESERLELEKLAHSRVEEHRLVERARMVLVASRTNHMCDAARALNTDKHTIRRWSERYLAQGLSGLRDRPRSGAPHRFTPEQIAKLVVVALTPPQELGLPFGSWTQQRLSDYLYESEGFRMSPSRVWTYLQREGLRWVQDEKWFTQQIDPDFLAKRGPLSSYTGIHPKEVS